MKLRMEIFSTVNAYDQFVKDTQDALNILPKVVKAYTDSLRGYEDTRIKWKRALEESNSVSSQLTEAHKEISSLQTQVHTARKLIDEEKRKRKQAEDDRDFFEAQLDQLREILQDNRNKLHEETKEKLSFLSKHQRPSMEILEERLNTINEFETTESIMSDLSYTRDEEDFLNISAGPGTCGESTAAKTNANKRSRPSQNKARKKRRSSSAVRTCELKASGDRVIATTTVTMDRKSQVHATAVIEAVPSGSENKENMVEPSAPPLNLLPTGSESDCPSTPRSQGPLLSTINNRPHNYQQKAILKSEICNVCSKKIRFSTMGFKCRDCKSAFHALCKDKAPLPCIPNGSTPGKAFSGIISDYTPLIPPMVPSLVVHCINEVEARGLSEVGLYRIPGSDKEVRSLKEKFLRGKGIPNLSNVQDIHTICGCLKEFLRSLKDTLVMRKNWHTLAQIAKKENEEYRREELMRLISELPQPNRDTLSYLMLHLQRVSEISECRMPKSNLTTVFGQTVVGYSCINPEDIYGETRMAHKIMGELLDLPSEFWESFIRGTNFKKTPSALQVIAPAYSPIRLRTLKNIRYFETP